MTAVAAPVQPPLWRRLIGFNLLTAIVLGVGGWYAGWFGAHAIVGPSLDYFADIEAARGVPPAPDFPDALAAPEEVETPGVTTIEALAEFLGIDPAAGKGDLAGMVAQGGGALRQQDGDALVMRHQRHQHGGAAQAQCRGSQRFIRHFRIPGQGARKTGAHGLRTQELGRERCFACQTLDRHQRRIEY